MFKRLTKLKGNYVCWNGNQDKTTNKRYLELLDHLAAYEDTGLTPGDVKDLQELCKENGLAKYVDLIVGAKRQMAKSNEFSIEKDERIEAQQHEIDQLKQNLKLQESLTMREMERVEAQQQEIEQHIEWNEAHVKARVEQDKLIDKLVKDKDEQAGRIMRMEDGMRQVQHDIDGAECRDDLNGIKVFIDDLLGGK